MCCHCRGSTPHTATVRVYRYSADFCPGYYFTPGGGVSRDGSSDPGIKHFFVKKTSLDSMFSMSGAMPLPVAVGKLRLPTPVQAHPRETLSHNECRVLKQRNGKRPDDTHSTNHIITAPRPSNMTITLLLLLNRTSKSNMLTTAHAGLFAVSSKALCMLATAKYTHSNTTGNPGIGTDPSGIPPDQYSSSSSSSV